MVVVDLPGALGRDDHERIARVDVFHQGVDARADHGRDMVAVRFSSRSTISRELLGRPLAVVVLDDVVEPLGLRELAPRQRDSLLDAAARLGRALGQAPLQLVDRGGDEDRHGALHFLLDGSAPSVSSSSSGAQPSARIRSISETSVP